MTPDELDRAIRQELRMAARLAPDPAPVRARVLHAAEAMAAQELPRRGLRAWSVPLLAAAAVLVALLLTTATQSLRSQGRTGTGGAGSPTSAVTPPAVSPSTTNPATPTPSASPSPAASTAAARGASIPSGTGRPAGTATSSAAGRHPARAKASSAAPAEPVPQDWFHGLDATALPHTPDLCPDGQRVDSVAGMGAPSISVAGEPAPLWLVPVTCVGAAGDPSPRPIEVFRYSPAGPQLVQTLAYQAGDPRLIAVTVIDVGAASVTFAESGYHADHDAVCCRSLRWAQTFTWDADHFVAGPQQDVVLPCADDQLQISGTRMGTEAGTTSGMRLTYANHGTEPCALVGYPAAAALDAAGVVLAEAARTPSGPLGAPSPGGDAARVVVFDQVTAEAVVEWSTVSQAGSSCYAHASVRVLALNGGPASVFSDEPLVCDLQVHPVR